MMNFDKSVNATSLRKDLYSFIEEITKNNSIIQITHKGGNCIMLSEQDWFSMSETLYINSIPGLAEGILAAADEHDDMCEVLE